MVKLLRHLYGVVQRVFDVSLCWTKGQNGDSGNVLADTLANEGCAMEFPVDRDFVPSDWNAEEFTNVLAESDLNQTIPVHELLGAHVQRLRQLERQRRRAAEAQNATQPVRHHCLVLLARQETSLWRCQRLVTSLADDVLSSPCDYRLRTRTWCF